MERKYIVLRYVKQALQGTRCFAPRPVWGLIAPRVPRSPSRCPSAVAAAKPACTEPAAGNRLADTVACVGHAHFRHRHIPELILGVHSSIDDTGTGQLAQREQCPSVRTMQKGWVEATDLNFLLCVESVGWFDWLSQGFTLHSIQNSHFGDVLTSQSRGTVLKKN